MNLRLRSLPDFRLGVSGFILTSAQATPQLKYFFFMFSRGVQVVSPFNHQGREVAAITRWR